MQLNLKCEVKNGPFGRGVFAIKPIKCGEVVEIAPVLLVPVVNLVLKRSGKVVAKQFSKVTENSSLNDQISRYNFYWTKHLYAIALGYGSLYNHSNIPNLTWSRNKKTLSLTFKARRDVAVGEELFFNYGYHPAEKEVYVQIEKKIKVIAQNKK